MTLAIADTSIAISQPGQANCTFQVSPVSGSIPRTPWTADVTVTTGRGCRWTATSDAPWLHLRAAGASVSGTLTYDADFNPATTSAGQRLGVIAVRWTAPTAGQNVRINQWGQCNVAIGPAPGGMPSGATYSSSSPSTGTLSVGPDGGRIHFFVLTDPFMGCAWTVESTDTWLSVDSPRLHQINGGDGDLYFTVPANPSSISRRAVLTMDQKPLTIVQQGR